jgi:hypothetical protein
VGGGPESRHDVSTHLPAAYQVTPGAQKARWGGVVAGVLGFFAPAAAYLLTVDGDGISTTELVHGGLIAVVAAAGIGGAVGGVVYAVTNKPTVQELTLPPAAGQEEL